MKKLRRFIILFIVLFLLFLYFYWKEYSYEVNYKVNDVDILEIYDKNQKGYQFVFTYKDEKYSIFVDDEYQNKRRVIDDIYVEENDDKTCLIPSSENVSVYGICRRDGSQEALNNTILNNEEKEEYLNYKIYDLNDKSFLLWNYHDFVWLYGDKRERIKLFSKDFYNLNLIGFYKNYLMVPDYDSSYTFDKIYMIDFLKGKVKEQSLRYAIYFDSYFLGSYKKNLYIYDKKQEQEYYISMKNNKIYKTGNKVLVNEEWEKVSSYKLKNGLVSFSNDEVYSYHVRDDLLYGYINNMEYETKISDMKVSKIVKKDGLGVYYISEDTLYYYHPRTGIKALISYSEWRFNKENMVYIF